MQDYRSCAAVLLVLTAVLMPSLAAQGKSGDNGERSQAGKQALPSGAIARLGTEYFRHGSRVMALAYSPNGKVLAAGGGNDPVRLWNAANGEPMGTLQETWVHTLAFHPQGKQIATGGGFKVIRIWDAFVGNEVRKLKGHTGTVKCIRYSKDGQFLVSGSSDRTIRIWRHSNGTLVRELKGHEGAVNAVAISPDGKRIASGGNDYTLRLWDRESGELLWTINARCEVGALAFTPDGLSIVSAGDDGQVRLWATANGNLVRSWGAHSEPVVAIELATRGEQVVSTGRDGTIRVSKVADGSEVRTITSDRGSTDAMAVSSDGRFIAASGRNNVIKRWHMDTGNPANPSDRLQATIIALGIPANKEWLVIGDGSAHVHIFDAKSRKHVRTISLPSWNQVRLALAPATNTLATVGKQDSIRLWDIKTGKEVGILSGDEKDPVVSLAFDAEGAMLAVARSSGRVQFWDVATRKLLENAINVDDRMEAMAFTPDGKRLVGTGSSTYIWDVATGQIIHQLGKGRTAACLAMSPDGKYVATGHFDSFIRLWDVQTGTEVRTLEGHYSAVYSLAFSPTGRYLVSGSFDNTVRLWELANGQTVSTWKGHAGPVFCAMFAPDGLQLISGGGDSAVLFWDATGISAGGKLPQLDIAGRQEDLWNQLAAAESPAGHRAMWQIAAAGEQGIELLHRRVFLVDREKIEKLINDLNSNRYIVRDQATIALQGFGQWIRGRLEEANKNPPSLEVRLRLQGLLKRLSENGAISLEQERLRMKRVMEILEHHRSPAARDLLTKMTKGAAENAIAEEARMSLERVSGDS